MYLDRLTYRNDIFKGFDGRCRLISCVVLIMAIVNATAVLVLIGVIVIGMLVLFRDLRITLLRLLPVNVIALALWLPVLFGLKAGAVFLYTLRINAAALVYMGFIIPMSISAIASSLVTLKVPGKLVVLLVLTYRDIFLLFDRFLTAQKSMRLRTTIYNHPHQWRTLSAVFASAIASAVFRSKHIWTALTLRGFDGTFPVTVAFTWRKRDTALLAISIACAVLVLLKG
ncbi:MAG: energy-coupling factor transporter transmembrane protein EcfT [Treponema sp.]|jgi:energy-coupling factor transporter transmembrane protein EcfT|nr:energy-coupling factor transporter transmembrane protein EcfT [Treponema sp.]